MSNPSFDQYVEPLLRYLVKRPDGATMNEACEALSVQLKLSDADRAEMIPSGAQRVYRNQIGLSFVT